MLADLLGLGAWARADAAQQDTARRETAAVA